MKRRIFICLLGVFIICSASKKDKPIQKEKESYSCFLGDLVLAKKGYFDNLIKNTGYSMIKNQNELYKKKFLDFENKDVISIAKGKIKYKIRKKINGKNYKIFLYTLIGDIKKDSIIFYENVSKIRGNDSYSCMSYLDLKKNEVWQIRLFSSSIDKNLSFISFVKSKVTESGQIKTDSLYYLDEALETDLYNYKIKLKLE